MWHGSRHRCRYDGDHRANHIPVVILNDLRRFRHPIKLFGHAVGWPVSPRMDTIIADCEIIGPGNRTPESFGYIADHTLLEPSTRPERLFAPSAHINQLAGEVGHRKIIASQRGVCLLDFELEVGENLEPTRRARFTIDCLPGGENLRQGCRIWAFECQSKRRRRDQQEICHNSLSPKLSNSAELI